MFRTSYEYREIKNRLIDIGAINCLSQFECMDGNCPTFSHEYNQYYLQFSFVTDSQIMRVMSIEDLINLESLYFFEYVLFENEVRKETIQWVFASELNSN